MIKHRKRKHGWVLVVFLLATLVVLIFLVLLFPTQVVSGKVETSANKAPKEVVVPRIAPKPKTITETIIAQKYVPPAAPKPHPIVTGVLSAAAIQDLGDCESHNTPTTNTGNGFYGAFQFTIGTWNNMQTGYARADLAPYEVQVAAVQKLVSMASIFSQFPDCSRRLFQKGLI